MNRKIIMMFTLIAALTITFYLKSQAAEPSKDAKPAQPEIQLPAGWTMEDMQTCILAGTPGKMQAYLAQSAGVWHGKTSMWMAPGADPVKSECKSVVTSILDGHFIQVEITGDMPGMGPYKGLSFFGFDNVSQKFTTASLDNQGTGIMSGTGELSADGKVMTWTYTFNCPLNKKPTPMRQVETTTGPKNKTLEIFSVEPKSGKEFKMMAVELTRE
jgi:hypothetical protein